MKRTRTLASMSSDIVEMGKEKDAYGKPLYPVMNEPFIMTLFGASDALFKVLNEQPLLLLNLLQTNKALNKFMHHVEGLWPLLIDMVLEKTMGSYVSDIYPFFVVQMYRTQKRSWDSDEIGEKPHVLPDFIGRRKTNTQYRPLYISYTDRCENPNNPVYYVVYYDEVTRLFMDLLAVTHPAIDLWPFASRYIKMSTNFCVASFVDCFLIAVSADDNTIPSISYDVEVLREGVITMVERVDKRQIELDDKHPDMYSCELAACHEAKKLGTKLTRRVTEEGEVSDAPVLMKLDKSTAQQYRTLLYDKEQGLLKKSQAQKDFYVRILDDLADDTEIITKDGQPLKCVICHSETHLVDPIHRVALCHEKCRAHYLK